MMRSSAPDHGGDDIRAQTLSERAALPLSGITAAAFAAFAALRRNRVFHPVGEAFSGTLTVHAQPPLPAQLAADARDVYVRLSRGAGLPEPVPDVLGLAIKVPNFPAPGSEQDLLLASSGAAVGVRNLLLPARNFLDATYSSVLPYRVGSEQVLFGARAQVRAPSGDFGALTALARRGDLRFDVLVATMSSPWDVIGTLAITGTCPQDVARALRFNPWNSLPELRPAGALNALRERAYPASQDARPS